MKVLENKKAPSFLTVLSAHMERAMGIEPTSRAWEARILPMNYARDVEYHSRFTAFCQTRMPHSSGRSMARSGMSFVMSRMKTRRTLTMTSGSNASGLWGTTTSARMAVSEVR